MHFNESILKPPYAESTLILDADMLLYAGACEVDKIYSDQEFEDKNDDFFIQWGVQYIIDYLDYLRETLYIQDTELALTVGRESFRYQIYPAYKQHRIKSEPPRFLSSLKSHLLNNFSNVIGCKDYEADDYVVWRYKQLRGKYRVLLASGDKDVLNAIDGTHFNTYKGVFVNITEAQARYFTFYQAIVGDTSDNVKGAHRIGAKKVANFITPNMSIHELWEGLFKAFNGNQEEALLNMRLVDMNQLDQNGNLFLREINS